MSLEGNLTAFGLSEILQLIAVQQKSGMLAITSQDRSKVLFFRDGSIISTRDRRRKTKDPLKDYLTRYGILSRDDLIRISQISAQSKLDLTEIIVSEDFLSTDETEKHYRNHIQEEIHELLTWEQCSYKFIPGLDIIDGIKQLGEFSIEGMLMESMRRIDEFPQMLDEFPTLDTRVEKKGNPGPDDELTSNEETILAALTRERDLAYLVAHAKMPRFETYEALKHLKEKNLINVLAEKTDETGKTRRLSRKTRRHKRRNGLPVAVSILLFLGGLAWGTSNLTPYLETITTQDLTPVASSSLGRSHAEQELRWRLEVYRALYRRYPSSLDDLEDSGLVGRACADRIQPWEFIYRLTTDGDRYTLL